MGWQEQRAVVSRTKVHAHAPALRRPPILQGFLPPAAELDPFPGAGSCNGIYVKITPAGQPSPAVGCPNGVWTHYAPGGAACAAVKAACTGASTLYQVLFKNLAVNTYCCRCLPVAPRVPSNACPAGWRSGGECATLPNWCTTPDTRLFNEYFSPTHCCTCSSPSGPGAPALPGVATVTGIQVVAQGDGHRLRITFNTASGTGEAACVACLGAAQHQLRSCVPACLPSHLFSTPPQAPSHTRFLAGGISPGKPNRSTSPTQRCPAGPARWGLASHCAWHMPQDCHYPVLRQL